MPEMSSVITKAPALRSFFNYCVKNSIPVACYSLPGSTLVTVMAQTGTAKSNTKTGFVFAPFNTQNAPNIFISAHTHAGEQNLPPLNFARPLAAAKSVVKEAALKTSTKKEYCNYVVDIQAAITQKKFKKAVAACVTKIKQPNRFEPANFFKKLVKAYPAAFVSLVYTPQAGIWIGATPEILLAVEGKQYTTYSLAGTQKRNDAAPVVWGKKEQQEQKFVSDYILQTFAGLTGKKPLVQGPETVTAANLAHLRTTFTFKGIPFNKWEAVAQQLHPTPAVAGLPKKKGVEFITAHEKSPRYYYSGYLGPVTKNEVSLFVNLRCMTVLKKHLAIYTGCGITKDSIPEKEWQETLIKKRTLLNVLQ